MKINNQLYDLYDSKWNDFLSMKDQLDNEGIYDYSSPLLMYCWEQEYEEGNKKILFVGQESNSWYEDGSSLNENSLNQVISNYEDFDLGNGYNSPFWHFVHNLNNRFNNSSHSFLWTNINKFGLDKGKGRPNKRVTELENQYFNILKDELNIINPDAVIFLTGPNYDNDIKNKLGSIKFIKCTTDHDVREFARLENQYLPYDSYRIYHPNYLSYNSSTDEYLDTLSNLL